MSALPESSDPLSAHRANLQRVLSKYLHPNAVAYCAELIIRYQLHLHIEVARKDRLGDYHPHLGKGNRISINHNLNPYDFLITFIHELAHHTTWKKYGFRHQAHGPEWKAEYQARMRPVVMQHMFPPDIEAPLIRHMRKPAYTHTGDLELMKALKRYDPPTNECFLEDLPEGALFKIGKRGRVVMAKGALRKTYYHCLAPATGKAYLVHRIASVIEVSR